jgi:hypothetical protein
MCNFNDTPTILGHIVQEKLHLGLCEQKVEYHWPERKQCKTSDMVIGDPAETRTKRLLNNR